MKYFLILLIGMLVAPNSFAQDYMTKIAELSGECLDKIPENLEGDAFIFQLGICMLEAAGSYEKQLKKDYGIVMEKIDTQGERLGQIIGMKMVGICPNAVMKIAEKTQASEAEEEPEKNLISEITKVENNPFVVFTLKDAMGKKTKCYWLSFVESELDLPNEYESLAGKKVEVRYVSQEVFDPRIEEHRPIFLLTVLSVL